MIWATAISIAMGRNQKHHILIGWQPTECASLTFTRQYRLRSVTLHSDDWLSHRSQPVRGNGIVPLLPEDLCVAEIMKATRLDGYFWQMGTGRTWYDGCRIRKVLTSGLAI